MVTAIPSLPARPVQKKRKAEAAKPKRGKKAVVDKRKAPKTGSKRRQNKNK